MTLTIDQAGTRPLGLKAGTDLEMRETAEGIVLKPVAKRPSLRRVGHFLVHTGKAPAGFDVLAAISNDREERLRKQSGL